MSGILEFADRAAFRGWLIDNCTGNDGVWLLFGKKGGPVTLSANDALEEALCFGWIDGQMQSLDEKSYKKYFAPRRANSNWSEKNKALVPRLEQQGLMTDFGRAKIEEARKNGQWDKPKALPVTDEQIAFLSALLKEYEPAHTNFMAMPPSVKKTYTRAYYDAKTDAGRANRIAWMVERLNQNLKPNNAIVELAMSITQEQRDEMHALQNLEPFEIVNASYNADAGFLKEEGDLTHLIGVLTTNGDASELLEKVRVEACTWAVFPNEGPFPVTLQNTMARVYSEWLPAADYEVIDAPGFSFTKMDAHKKDYAYCEVWTPVKKK